MFYSSVSGQPDGIVGDNQADQALSEAINLYDRRLGQNSFVYNGRIYNEKFTGTRGHPYFSDDYWITGRITFQDMVFDSLELIYEIYHDQLLLSSFNNHGRLAPIILNSRDIKNFELHGHTFVFLEYDSVSNLREGFYDEVYSGPDLKIYIKRKKEISTKTFGTDMWTEFSETNIYYLKKENTYYLVRNRKSAINAFKEYKKELITFIKNRNLDFRADMEGTLLKIVAWFESQ
jgi:hypothetical protein